MSDEDYRRIFARNLNKYMEICNKKQADIINDLGINKSAISTWINGTRMPRMDKVQALADYFGINKSDLLEDKPEHDSSYYINEDAKELAQFLFKNPEYKILFDAAKDVSADDLEMVKTIIDKFKK
jgi:DNA-binding protein|nr:MAG TPA: Repressor protein CI [Caudoviricetes sp.]